MKHFSVRFFSVISLFFLSLFNNGLTLFGHLMNSLQNVSASLTIKNGQLRYLFLSVGFLTVLTFGFLTIARADGSKDLYPGTSGIRAVLRSSNTTGNSWPFANQGTHYVYAKANEVITLASSAQGSGSARIRLYAPNGTMVVDANSGGQIANRTAEVAGP